MCAAPVLIRKALTFTLFTTAVSTMRGDAQRKVNGFKPGNDLWKKRLLSNSAPVDANVEQPSTSESTVHGRPNVSTATTAENDLRANVRQLRQGLPIELI